ncbi:MAG: hypothetical protein R2697_14800 [Ilumatobacteraceae bacterium]
MGDDDEGDDETDTGDDDTVATTVPTVETEENVLGVVPDRDLTC